MKLFSKVICVVAFAFILNACDKEEKEVWYWDFINYPVEFAVEDAETGSDLLNPATEGNILGQEIKVIYNGEEYLRYTEPGLNLTSCKSNAVTRESFLLPFALRWGSDPAGRYWLAFGEFDPTAHFHQESFIIDWGDGTQNEILLDCYTTWKGNDPTVHRALWMDGVARGEKWMIEIKK